MEIESNGIAQQCKLSAWTEVKKDLSKRQREVLEALKEIGGIGTMHSVSIKMFVPLHTISGRFSELRKKGCIRELGLENRDGVKRTLFALG